MVPPGTDLEVETTRATGVTGYLLEGKDRDQVALRMLRGDHTYGELREAARQVAGYLLGTGFKKGDRVILASENSLFWVAAYLGTMSAGLVCVPLPVTISPDDFDYVLTTTGAGAGFVGAGFAARRGNHFRHLHLVTDREVPRMPEVVSQTSFAELRQRSDTGCSLPSIHPDELAALMFTSGSTGRPRGVMVSHRNIMANTESIIQYLGLNREDRMMTVLPFHYCFGTSLLHTHLRVGASLVIEPRFMYPETVLQRMIETECTGFAGVPSHFQILLRKSSLARNEFPRLRYVQQAGGRLAPSFIRELREALPETSVFIMYGQTEATARLSYLPPEFLDSKLGSIGKGIPGVKLRVLNDAGEEVGPGEIGEVVAEGENVAKGYWRAPEESAVSFRNGKLYTGDLATVDEDGFIYIVDRAKDFLKCGGKRVSCREIEERLLESGALIEAAVVGVPDEILGEAVKAYVVPRAQDSDSFRKSLDLWCKERLPYQLLPKEVVALRSLPKNSAGKVLKAKLREK